MKLQWNCSEMHSPFSDFMKSANLSVTRHDHRSGPYQCRISVCERECIVSLLHFTDFNKQATKLDPAQPLHMWWGMTVKQHNSRAKHAAWAAATPPPSTPPPDALRDSKLGRWVVPPPASAQTRAARAASPAPPAPCVALTPAYQRPPQVPRPPLPPRARAAAWR